MMRFLALACVLLCLGCDGLIVQPLMLQHRVDGTAQMSCVLQKSPMDCSNIKWIGPALTAGPSSRIRISGHFHVSLTIHELMIGDQGSYSCVCGENKSPPAFLEVFIPPDFHGLDRNQSFEIGDTAIVRCDAFPGDPPSTPVWRRGGVTINSMYMDTRYRLQHDNQSLIIEDIRDSDKGTFRCGFNTIMGYVGEDINVRVTAPTNPGFSIIQPQQRDIYVNYGDPLILICKVNTDPASVNISWIINQQTIIHNSRLELQPEEVESGLYRCFAYNSDNERHHSVFVTVNARPMFTKERIDQTSVAEANEGNRLERNEETITTSPILGGHPRIQWRRKGSNSLMDFGSRLKVTWTKRNIRWIIYSARLEDNGDYVMNISNDFGYTELNTLLVVTKTEKTEVQIQISDQDCQLLKEHKDELAKVIARAYKVCDSYCGDVPPAVVDCRQDMQAVVSLYIQNDYVENVMVEELVFNLSGVPPFIGTVCTGCIIGPSKATTPEKSIIIAYVVLAVLLSIALVVLSLTIFICKCWKSRCNKQCVAEANVEDPPVHMDDQQRHTECTGYEKVHRPPVIQPPEALSPATTPITELFVPSRQFHLPPSPLVVARGVEGRASTKSPGKRPNNLIIRSYSDQGYGHSSRTRTPPDARSRERM